MAAYDFNEPFDRDDDAHLAALQDIMFNNPDEVNFRSSAVDVPYDTNISVRDINRWQRNPDAAEFQDVEENDLFTLDLMMRTFKSSDLDLAGTSPRTAEVMQLILLAGGAGLDVDRHRGDYIALWENGADSKTRITSKKHKASYAEIIWDRTTEITASDWNAARDYTP